MQPGESIPPYHPDTLTKLIGVRCAVPKRNGPGVWWVNIENVRFVSPKGAVVFVKGHRAFGTARWMDLAACRFKKHTDDPLAIAIAKGKEMHAAGCYGI